MAACEHTARVFASAAARHQPLSVSLELTHRCDFSCRHCYIPDHVAPDGLSTARILTLLDELAAAGTLFLALTGGEPLVRGDWIAIARAAREERFALTILTNGGRIDAAAADEIAGLFATIEVSAYSMDPIVFDAITGRAGSFAAVFHGVELLRERGVPVMLKVPVMSANAAGIAAVFEYAARVGAECRAYPHIVHDKAGSLRPLAMRASDAELLTYYRARFPGAVALPEPVPPPPDGPLCAAAARFCNITAVGDVLACNLIPVPAGNVNERPFVDIWENSTFFTELRALRRGDLSTCATCRRLSYCGRCHACALVEDGNLRGPWSFACRQAELLERAAAEPEGCQVRVQPTGDTLTPPPGHTVESRRSKVERGS
jgi:radical SAM protein with 4Fe4S-binding SPASM domain